MAQTLQAGGSQIPSTGPVLCSPSDCSKGVPGLQLKWALDELLFELVGLVLCLTAWAVMSCLLGLRKGRPWEGAPRKSLTPRAASGSQGPTPSPYSGHPRPEVRGLSTWASPSPHYLAGEWEGRAEMALPSNLSASHPVSPLAFLPQALQP